jgi:hypothetical protein
MMTAKNTHLIGDVSPTDLLGYMDVISTSTKKGSYYNLPSERAASLNHWVSKIVDSARPFAALMCLTKSITDDARIATAIHLLGTAPKNPDPNASRRWECSVLLDAMEDMPPARVFDMFHYLIGMRAGMSSRHLRKAVKAVGGRFLRGLILRWLSNNYPKLDLWSVKYRKAFGLVARHMHLSPKAFHGVSWLFGGPPATPMQTRAKACQRSGPGQVPAELWELPMEVARGFALSKAMMTPEEFEREFSNRGHKTLKEKRLSAVRTAEAGGKVEYDPSREKNLFSLFTYLGGLDAIPANAQDWVHSAAKNQAKKMRLTLESCAVVLDTSPSMWGVKEAKRHPLFKALAATEVLRAATVGQFDVYYTSPQNRRPTIPLLHGATEYVHGVHSAIEAGHKRIILLGDGYENAPAEAMDTYLNMLKNYLDPDDKISVIHLNPVGASETGKGIKELSIYAPSAGLAHVDALPAAIFVAMAKKYPDKAIEVYLNQLVKLQSPGTAALMPAEYRTLLLTQKS